MAIKLKRFSDSKWYVGHEFNPVGPGGFRIMKESTYKKKLAKVSGGESKFDKLALDALKSFECFDNKQDAIDRKIELQIKKWGKRAALTPSQKERAKELGFL